MAPVGPAPLPSPGPTLLAAGVDRDVSEVRAELRAHAQDCNTLRETQRELRETQLEQGRVIDGLPQEMHGGFATMATVIAQITALLTEIRGPKRDGY